MMGSLPPKKLTGWLTLLIIILGPVQFCGTVRSLSTVPESFRPYLAGHPSLSTAIMIFQLLVGASAAVWAYAAWVLYRREPGSLKAAQTSLLVGAALRIVGSFSIAFFGGLPPDTVRSMIERALPATVIWVAMIAGWYLYLIQSGRVRDIYTAEQIGSS